MRPGDELGGPGRSTGEQEEGDVLRIRRRGRALTFSAYRVRPAYAAQVHLVGPVVIDHQQQLQRRVSLSEIPGQVQVVEAPQSLGDRHSDGPRGRDYVVELVPAQRR